TSEYTPRGTLKGSKGPISAITFTKDVDLVFIGSDDGHVRIYSVKDLAVIQVLHDKAWGKITALSYVWAEPPVGDKDESLCVGNIRGSVALIPRAQTSWFSQKALRAYDTFPFNDSVAVQAYDPMNKRLALASHGGTIKLYSVATTGGFTSGLTTGIPTQYHIVDLTELWTIRSTADAIPIGLKFFGGGNQSIILHKIETGEMSCLDAQTSDQLWQKHMGCAM
ncbi:hypothetical protein DXG01_012673, partial [Tephrocybe rancida]